MVAQLRPLERVGKLQRVEAEIRFLAEADDENALAVLRHKRLRVDHAKIDVVAKLLRQNVVDDLERLPAIMIDEVLHVLEEKRFRPVMLDDARNVEKQRSLGLARKTVRTVQRVLLRDAGDGKRLAGKPGEQHVMRGNVCLVHLADVAGDLVRVAGKIRAIGLLAVAVPFAGEDALAADASQIRAAVRRCRRTGR